MCRLFRYALPLLFMLCLGAGCDSGSDDDLIGPTWVLDQMDLPPGDPTEPIPTTIRFESDNAVSIRSCNQCSGPYGSSGKVLDLSRLACTKIGCGDQLDLGPRLGAADRVVYSISDDGLILVAEQDGLLSTFTFVAE